MKNFVSIFCILAIVVCVHCKPSEEARKLFEECIKEVGITEKLKGPPGPPNFDDPKEKCFHTCVMKKKGIMEDGKIDAEKFLEHHHKKFPNSPENTRKLLSECIDTANEESDECEVGASFMKCAHENLGPPPHPHHHKDNE